MDTPRLDAEVLLADVLGLDRVRLYINFDRPLDAAELGRYREYVRRRAAREPVAYITGRKEFYSLDLKVGPGILIPRPETELLVDEALALVKERWPDKGDGGGPEVRCVDLGTGSGAVALALAFHLTRAVVYALDVEERCVARARENAKRLGLEERVVARAGDLLAPMSKADGGIHLIAANLPYVPLGAFADMAPEVRDHEPHSALDGGADGLALIRRAVADARGLLTSDGVLLLEMWPTHAAAVRSLGDQYGYGRVRIVKDLSGRDRMAVLEPLHDGE